MKKTYMIPTLKVVEIKPAQILAGSVDSQSLNRNSTPVDNPSSVGARRARFSEWDEEE